MVGLTDDQRQMLLDKLPDAANLVLGALLLGQFLSDRGFSLTLASAGIVGWLALFGLAFWLGREEKA
jgi:hypothetical protein